MFFTNLILGLLLICPSSDNHINFLSNLVLKTQVCEEIDPFIDDLYYQDEKIRFVGSDNLLRLAAQSNFCRMKVIEALSRVLQDKKLLNYQKGFRYHTWYDALNLLDKLNATEKLDLIIEHLDYTIDSKDISSNYYPVVKVAARLSQNSIKDLSRALFEHKDIVVRINAARSLSLVGTQEAKIVLSKALKSEKDPQVKFYIQEQINNWLIARI